MADPFPDPPLLHPVSPRGVEDIKLRLHQLWHGQIPLAQTFWLYYFVIVFVLKLLGRTQGPLGELFDALALIWAGFMIKPIISAADNYKGDRIWSILAKIAAVIVAVAVLSDLLAF